MLKRTDFAPSHPRIAVASVEEYAVRFKGLRLHQLTNCSSAERSDRNDSLNFTDDHCAVEIYLVDPHKGNSDLERRK